MTRTESGGRYVFGAGIVFIAALCLAWGTFDPGQPVPKGFPARTELAYLAGAFMLLSGVALEWRRTAAWGAAALTAYYVLIVIILMNGRIVLAHFAEYGTYEGLAEQVAIGAGALIVYASTAEIGAALASRLVRAGRVAFALCAIVFGGAHFAYMNLTAPLVPKWLPPNQIFWGYATGVFHIAAGLAILSGIQARIAAILLTIMYASFTPLVHLPLLVGAPSNHFYWTENAANLVLTGAAWVVAHSLARARLSKAESIHPSKGRWVSAHGKLR